MAKTKVKKSVADAFDTGVLELTTLLTVDMAQADNYLEVLSEAVSQLVDGTQESVAIVRGAWTGKKKPKKQAFSGARFLLKNLGFTVDKDSVVVKDNKVQSWQSAEYTNVDGVALKVTYGQPIEEHGYGHVLTLAS